MAYTVRKVDYFFTTVEDQPGQGCTVLKLLADKGVNLLAFTAMPMGDRRTELGLFPDDVGKLEAVARTSKLQLSGPNPALLLRGDDELGALAEVHQRLCDADVNVYASTGVTDGRGSYGCVLFVRPGEMDRAAAALGL
jgi:hypothetical protein